MSFRKDFPPDEDEILFELPEGLSTLPFARDRSTLPADHPSFDDFWRHLGKEDSSENARLRELFYEWLGQNGFDVHHRDEPTVIGDLANWTRVWERYLQVRKLR